MKVKDVNLTPAELQAILDHKRVLSAARGGDVAIEEAIAHFVDHYRLDWLREKQRRDMAEQRQEIERHKYLRSEKAGFDIGRAQAAEEWCEKYAPIWRAEHESLERNGFLIMRMTVRGPDGLHFQPSSTLAELVGTFDGEVYVHRPGMVYSNFRLQGKPYLNVKSVLGLLTVAARPGEDLEWIATGPQAKAALEAIAAAIDKEAGPPDIEGVAGIEAPATAASAS